MSDKRRENKRQPVTISGMVYDLDGSSIVACTVRNISVSGAQIELVKEHELPVTFLLWLSRDGSVRRRCQSVWQLSTVAGVRFQADSPSENDRRKL